MEKKEIGELGQAAQAAERLTREARKVLLRLVGPSAKELGLMMGDAVRIVRTKTVSLVLVKAEAKLEATKLQINPVPNKTLIPLLEKCSLEQEDDMIERWANLLAAAACGDPVLPTYVRLLAELTPKEARLLDSLKKLQEQPAKLPRSPYAGVQLGILRANLHLSPDEFPRIIINLIHLGLVHRSLGGMMMLPSTAPQAFTDEDPVGTTLAANDFLAVCSQPPSGAQDFGHAQ